MADNRERIDANKDIEYNNNNNNNLNNNHERLNDGIPPENYENLNQGPVQKFYIGASVMITGATGFVGKTLLEKLLRSCPDITKIFILIRSKRGVDSETRFKELMKNPIFKNLLSEKPEALDKVVAVSGDVTEPALGIDEKEQETLMKEVTIVFHSAATVRFNEKLEDAVKLNTEATQNVVSFCRKINNLKAFVHVSTAYSNADKRYIEEYIYPPPANPEQMIQLCHTLSNDTLDDVGVKLLQSKHPNTYTLTKAMAEWIVAEECYGFPTAVVRPSIVTAAWKEPIPGWVDNISGITGIMMEIGRGTIKSIICKDSLVVDIIPVDVVVNTLIVAAWHTSTFRCNDVRVYNCTSGSRNGILWKELGDLTQQHALETPSRHVQWYPGFTFRTNRLMHFFFEIFFHFLPAVIIDVILKLQGTKPLMVKLFQKFKNCAKAGEFFALTEFKFSCENQRQLSNDTAENEREIFQTNIETLDWNEYVKNYMMGIRSFVLKDSLESLPMAKRKLRRLYWFNKITQFLAILLLLKFMRW